MAADAYESFVTSDSNPATVSELGAKFRSTFLEQGGGTHPRDVFRVRLGH